MSNNRRDVAVVTDWAVLKALAHPLRREILRRCSRRARSVGELAVMFGVNPGTVLYHMRRLEATSLVVLQDAKRKRGIVEKRYRSVAHSVLLHPPAAEVTEERLAPLVAAIAASVRTIDASQAVRRQAALVGNIAEARIGMVHQREITKRLAELALWIESLAEDEKGTLMRLAAIFGPAATPAKPARRHSKP